MRILRASCWVMAFGCLTLAAIPASALPANTPIWPLGKPTAEDLSAHTVWNVRAALNVAALQCQFSPFLATVRTYNQFLQQHDHELKSAHDLLLARFRHDHGPRLGMQLFDRYVTRTYNGFSTLDAQLSFCATAAQVGRQALFVSKGQFSIYAGAALAALQESLKASGDSLAATNLGALHLPDISRCYDRSGRLRKACYT